MRPYPKKWERRAKLHDGAAVFIRPLKPEDAALYPDFAAELTPNDIRLRFFAPMRELDPRLVDQLVHVDLDRAIAFAALDESSGKLLGVVRLHFEDLKRGEYAVIVRSHLKGLGLGWVLMKHMINYARAEGLEEIFGEVLSENSTMLMMCEQLGFHVADEPDSPGVKLVTLRLDSKAVEELTRPAP